jgi:hypothetical protein
MQALARQPLAGAARRGPAGDCKKPCSRLPPHAAPPTQPASPPQPAAPWLRLPPLSPRVRGLLLLNLLTLLFGRRVMHGAAAVALPFPPQSPSSWPLCDCA